MAESLREFKSIGIEPLASFINEPQTAPKSDVEWTGDRAADSRPLCVDLDGTLVRTDTLVEGLVSLLANPRLALKLPDLLSASRASFKQKLAAIAGFTPELLPLNDELVHFLRGQKEAGRKIILVTAADEKTARAVASHVGFFDDVLASDGERNLKGEEKAKELTRRFGRGGFDYAGDSRADLAVWREANGIILVNASPAVARQARALGNVTAEFGRSRPVLREVIRAMRPHQWVKNLLVFVPLLASRSFTDMPGLIGALLMFAAFCATASGIYLINDLSDLDADRRHPRKRNRPFASGALSLPIGVFLALFLLLIGYVLAESAGAVIQLGWYAAISLAYSLALKRYPLVDVFVLAALYTIRIVAGGVASGHLTTLWLLAFSGFTFLSLAFVKRAAEIISLSKDPRGSNQSIAGRGYYSGDYQTLQMFGVASAFASSVVLALFVSSTASFEQYSSPEMLWGVVPLVLFWQLRLWLSTQRGHMHDDPIVYASKDWVSWLVGASVGLIALMASAGIKLW